MGHLALASTCMPSRATSQLLDLTWERAAGRGRAGMEREAGRGRAGREKAGTETAGCIARRRR